MKGPECNVGPCRFFVEKQKIYIKCSFYNLAYQVDVTLSEEYYMSEEKTEEKKKHTIKHLALSGGVIYAFSFYGAIQRLHQEGWLNVYEIETIHATSAGALVGTILALWCMREPKEEKEDEGEIGQRAEEDLDQDSLHVPFVDWVTLDNYFIHRPWQHVFQFSLETFLHCYDKCGLFGTAIFEDILRPLFSARDLNILTITMKEFYDITHIEQHFFTVSLTDFTLVDISHKTHPHWRVLDAVYASSCAPFLFQPLCIETQTEDITKTESYIDGYFVANYPIEPCVQWCDERHIPLDTVLGIHLFCENTKKNCVDVSGGSSKAITSTTSRMNLLEYIQILINNIMKKSPNDEYKSREIRPYEIHISSTIDVYEVNRVANSKEERQQLIDIGAKHADQFIACSQNLPDSSC